MKKFKFEYSTLTYVLLGIVALATAVGGAWNVYNLIEFSYMGALKIVLYSLVVVLCFAVTVCALAVIFYGKYEITQDKLICRLGVFRTAIPVKDLKRLTHFRKSNKLVAYYKDKYTVIVINEKEYEDFILTLREINGNIEYDVQTDGEDTPSL